MTREERKLAIEGADALLLSVKGHLHYSAYDDLCEMVQAFREDLEEHEDAISDAYRDSRPDL